MSVIQGIESSGKTTVALQALAECQSRGGVTIYLECESAFEADRGANIGIYNDVWVEKLNLDVEPLLILRPMHIPEAFAMIEFNVKKVRALDPDVEICVVWDSVAATPPSAEASEDNDDYQNKQPGQAAREVSMGFRRMTSIISDNNVVLICLNFIKTKIGGGFPGARGSDDATIAQRALGQHASVRIKLIKIGSIKGASAKISKGVRVLAKNTKNKIAPPFREVEFDMYYTSGMDDEGSKLDLAKTKGIVKSSGGWLTYGETRFRSTDWPKVDCHDEVVTKLEAKVAKEQADALYRYKPDKDDEDREPDDSDIDFDEQEDDDDYGPTPKGKRKVDDDD
jgi:recombination protein RecA